MYLFPKTCKFVRASQISDHLFRWSAQLLPRCIGERKRTVSIALLLCLCWGSIGLVGLSGPVFGQTAEVTQRVIPAAEITDLAFLRTFLEEQFIFPEDPAYTHGLFFDLTRDGFGSNDVLVLYPGEEQFLLGTYLPEQMATVLSTQGSSTDYSLVTTRERIGMVAEEAEQELNPKKALAGSFLESTVNYHPDGDLEGYISLQGENVRASFWGYTEDLWQFLTPAEAQCLQPDAEPMILVAHKQPEIRAFLDVDGCVVVESSTAAAQVTSRECNK